MHRPLGVASYDRRCAHLRHLLCWVRDLQPSPAFPALTAAPAATTSARTSSARARIRCARVVVFTAAFYFDSYNMQPARQRAELPSNLQRWLHLRHLSETPALPTAFHRIPLTSSSIRHWYHYHHDSRRAHQVPPADPKRQRRACQVPLLPPPPCPPLVAGRVTLVAQIHRPC